MSRIWMPKLLTLFDTWLSCKEVILSFLWYVSRSEGFQCLSSIHQFVSWYQFLFVKWKKSLENAARLCLYCFESAPMFCLFPIFFKLAWTHLEYCLRCLWWKQKMKACNNFWILWRTLQPLCSWPLRTWYGPLRPVGYDMEFYLKEQVLPQPPLPIKLSIKKWKDV